MSRFVAGIVWVMAALAGPVAPSAAQDYPTKPIRMIVPFPPGGGTDLLSRVVTNKLSESLKQAIVIENKPGAGGNIGVDLAAKSAPDGYTIVMGQTSNMAVNATLYPKLPYDPLKDLTPVALVADSPILIVVSAESPYRSLADLIAAAKAKPETVTFASPGNGTVAHLSSEILQGAAGIKFQHIPYKGAAPAITDLLGGRVDLLMSSVPTLLGHVKGGKLRAIALTGPKRSAMLPETPTVAESGFPGFDANTWFGILVPAGTPDPIVRTLNKEINAALQAPEVREKIRTEGGDALGGTSDAFAGLLKSELEKWAKVVKSSGAKVD
jgi:tripartite-type tricarboxylate transporter receptor subunit TctC